MNLEKIISACDHTLLLQDASWEEIKEICQDAMQYQTASVCIPPCYVKQAKEYVGENMKICTVIGFPNGNVTTETKVFETIDALKNGADEIDMVINIGMLKSHRDEYVLSEIKQIKETCGTHILKVIIETNLLSRDEKIRMCHIITESGADYIKTSTGFSGGGATFDDVKLFSEHIGNHVKIKASGGISSLEDAQAFLDLGVSRLGTSKLIKIRKERSLPNPTERSETHKC